MGLSCARWQRELHRHSRMESKGPRYSPLQPFRFAHGIKELNIAHHPKIVTSRQIFQAPKGSHRRKLIDLVGLFGTPKDCLRITLVDDSAVLVSRMEQMNERHNFVGVPMPHPVGDTSGLRPQLNGLILIARARIGIEGNRVVDQDDRAWMAMQQGILQVAVGLVIGVKSVDKDQIKTTTNRLLGKEGIATEGQQPGMGAIVTGLPIKLKIRIDPRLGFDIDSVEGDSLADTNFQVGLAVKGLGESVETAR